MKSVSERCINCYWWQRDMKVQLIKMHWFKIAWNDYDQSYDLFYSDTVSHCIALLYQNSLFKTCRPLTHRDSPTSAFKELGLKVCATAFGHDFVLKMSYSFHYWKSLIWLSFLSA